MTTRWPVTSCRPTDAGRNAAGVLLHAGATRSLFGLRRSLYDRGHRGAALWGPPGKPRLSGIRGLLALVPLAPRVAGPTLPRALRLLGRLDALHPTEAHWYLSTIGTDPDQQGRGVGSALMAPGLERCDAEGVRAYLESSKEANLPFYRRFGFEVTSEIVTEGGPTIWQMWREPQPPD